MADNDKQPKTVKVDFVTRIGYSMDESFRGFNQVTYGTHWTIWEWDNEIVRIPTSQIQIISSTEETE